MRCGATRLPCRITPRVGLDFAPIDFSVGTERGGPADTEPAFQGRPSESTGPLAIGQSEQPVVKSAGGRHARLAATLAFTTMVWTPPGSDAA